MNLRFGAGVTVLALSLAIPRVSLADDSLLRDLGGMDGIGRLANAAVENFIADPRITHQFDESNMTRLREKLTEEFCVVASGPCKYTGHSMAAAHRGLHLHDADFNALVEDLQKAMDGLHIDFRTQNRFLARLAPMHRDVVAR